MGQREWIALLLTALAFIALNDVLSRLYRWVGIDVGMVVLLLISVVVVLSAKNPLERSSARTMAFGCAAILGFYALMLVPGFAPDPELASVDHLHGLWRWIAIAAVPLCWRWPGLSILPVGFVMLYKAALAQHTGLTISPTDYLPVVELGLFLCLGLVIGSSLISPPLERTRYLQWLFLVAVGVHIANYFWSGVAKLVLSENPLYWLLHNDTSNIVLVSHVIGTLPVSGDNADTLAHLARDNVFALNLLTLLLQLLSPMALLSRKFLIGFTLAFDVSHIAIFLCSGIFFWKWILLNLVIVAAASSAFLKPLNWTQYLLLPFVVVFSSKIFFTAELGWLDTPSTTISYVEAEFTDGSRSRLPSNAFLASSITAAQMRLVRPLRPTNGTGTWGQTSDVNTFERVGEQCRTSQTSETMTVDFSKTSARLKRHLLWLQANHNGDQLIGSSHWYPHHIFSNPDSTAATNGRHWNDIQAFRYVSELHCVALTEAGITSSIIASEASPPVELSANDQF